MRLLDSAQSLLVSVLSLARNRLELFGTELQEELARLFLGLLYAVIVALVLGLAAVFGGIALIISLGEEYRALAAGLIALACLAMAGAAAWAMRRLTHEQPRAFDASLKELARDYETLRP
jgi:uncharacterized membrane protein YqjE